MLVLIAVLVAVAIVAWIWSSRHGNGPANRVTIYYTKEDGSSEVPWPVSVRPASAGEDVQSQKRDMLIYAATQAIAGPPSDVAAIRFPPGTHVRTASVTGTTATIDLSREVRNQSGELGEAGEFKALVWTLTALPGIDAVQVLVDGQRVTTLPGGQLESR